MRACMHVCKKPNMLGENRYTSPAAMWHKPDDVPNPTGRRQQTSDRHTVNGQNNDTRGPVPNTLEHKTQSRSFCRLAGKAVGALVDRDISPSGFELGHIGPVYSGRRLADGSVRTGHHSGHLPVLIGLVVLGSWSARRPTPNTCVSLIGELWRQMDWRVTRS